jgi:hypothetical protein
MERPPGDLLRFGSLHSVSNTTFGPLIAYLVPGATTLWGVGLFVPGIQAWFATQPEQAPTIGGFLYLTIASIACGMTVTAIRWAVIDTLHQRTGLGVPNLNFAKLADRVEAYHLLIEIHYRHYQFYANMAVATAIAYLRFRVQAGFSPWFGWLEVMFVALELVFFGTSRDTLSKYHRRSAQLLGTLSGEIR